DRGDRDCIGCGIEAMVHLPPQHAEGSGRSAVEALGRPGDPVLLVREHKQSQEFAAIVHAVPTDCAVAIGRDYQSAVTGDVDRPDYARRSTLPEALILPVNRSQIPVRSKHESTSVRMDCQASRVLVSF